MAKSRSKDILDHSINLLSQEKSQRRSILRLGGRRLDDTVDSADLSLNYSRLFAEDSMLVDKKNRSLLELMDDTSSTGLILKSDKPWRKVSSKLYTEFLEIIQSHSTEPEIFDTIADFIQNCNDTVAMMREMQAKVNITEQSGEQISLENERNTWRLIYCLYQNRLNNYHSIMETETNSNISEKLVIGNLLTNDAQVREYQLIIDWLEKNALDQADYLPKIEHFTDKTVAWENTLHQLQNRQGGITFGSSRPLVSSLDPDAPVREGKPLHDLDKEDDARLERRMFVEIRSGRLQKAQELAIHCGQPWRAACLLGWQPHHDPNYSSPLTDTKLPIEGNPNRSLWKCTAWHMSQDVRLGTFCRAIYASFCGNVYPLLTVARSWSDALWAHVKVLMDIEVEAEVRGIMAKNYVTMPDEYWKAKLNLEDIFNDLQASKDPIIRVQASEPDLLIQKYLILDQIPKLMDEIETWIDDCSSQFIRFLAHLIMFLRRIGKSCKEQIGDKVLRAYVRVLIDIGDPTLIAFYTATLPQEEQVVLYASYLEGVRATVMRKLCLSAAEDANLNVEAITKMVVENIRGKNVEDFDTIDRDVNSKNSEFDLEKIEALDWVTFYTNQREEALWQANALIRYFLTCDKIDAARKAFNKVPADSIEVIMMEHPTMENTLAIQEATNEIIQKATASIREYLCFKAYLDAQEGFQEWFQHFHQGKPMPVESLPTYATFTEKVAHDHKKAQYEADLERWKCVMEHHTKAVKQLLFNVLLFPDGGWLVDTCGVNSEDPLRAHQLNKLRNLCIPKITLLLLTVMSEMNDHYGCVELADTIVSEQHKLYTVFSKERMREVYRKICESSVILMDQKKDPWGYSK